MNKEKYEKVIEILTDKIASLESDIFIKDIEIENLKKENTQLNEYLTPKAKGGAGNE